MQTHRPACLASIVSHVHQLTWACCACFIRGEAQRAVVRLQCRLQRQHVTARAVLTARAGQALAEPTRIGKVQGVMRGLTLGLANGMGRTWLLHIQDALLLAHGIMLLR